MKILDNLPLLLTLVVAGFLALAPFSPEPHLWEKIKMLYLGTLSRPLDIFDLLLHGSGFVVFAAGIARWAVKRSS
ncbi:MAG: hypothetical protein BMS9Abin33_0490 [Gammaproteobacteria bacterium]|nr:MAG: hypothetical protein BMS9Abin33_0490 [Gammaproteobacteria bacterium]